MSEPRLIVAYGLILLVMAVLAAGWLRLTEGGRRERRLERLAERARRARRDARRQAEAAAR